MFKRVLYCTAAAVVAMTPSAAAVAHGNHHQPPSRAFTYAVYGDAPYGTTPTDTSETDATPAFIRAVNADPAVETVVHVGDIHSGSQYCTQQYDQQIYDLWKGYADPLVYTPGDNEWTDCHKAKEGGGTYNATTGAIDYVLGPDGKPVNYAAGNPVANLNLVRSIFFRHPGQTLGHGHLPVVSQASVPTVHKADRQFVENVIWQKQGIVFVTVNIPGGSNNDADPWYGAPSESTAQVKERTERTAAGLRWLNTAFAYARVSHAAGVVIVAQADMWDLDGKTADHLTNYEPIVANVAHNTAAFKRPVLMLNGDSHVYRSDNPLQQGASCVADQDYCSYDSWSSHPSYDVPNFHRIVVHGSTVPLEYLRLTIDPAAHGPATDTSFGPFSWTRVVR